MAKRPWVQGSELQAKRPKAEETTRIFVGGLAYSTNWQSLKDHFTQVGEVEFASVMLKQDGSSKGCGMINYRTPEEAMRAVEVLHESELDGRNIMVRLDVAGGDKAKPTMAPVQGVARGGGPLPRGELELRSAAWEARQSAAAAGFQEPSHSLPPDQIKRVFVGSLAFATTWRGLKDHFKPAGEIEFASVLETPTGQSKGCGMVNFFTNEEAMLAVELFNGSTLDGRQITVKLDVDGKFKERPPPKPHGQMQFQGQVPLQEEESWTLPPEEICRVFVGNLAFGTNWQALKDHFAQIGEIEFASVLLNPDRTSKGCGMVNFHNHEDAMTAVELLNKSNLDGREITVKLDVDGRFKKRPDPGARPRVHQAKELPDAPRLSAPMLMGASPGPSQALGAQAQANLAKVLNMFARATTGPQGQQASADDILRLLGQVARTPNASQINWPVLISTVADSYANQGR